MNRKETKQAIELMQAYADGAEIQARGRGPNGEKWFTCVPGWSWDDFEYRVKPKPREWLIDPSSGFVRSAEWGLGELSNGYIRVREVIDE